MRAKTPSPPSRPPIDGILWAVGKGERGARCFAPAGGVDSSLLAARKCLYSAPKLLLSQL